ncbi:MAG: hypothetical protein HYT86_02430 [candidate division NC10 bacterium]|nr:hypothetical protein [candidate division NC10 bacterium]
MGLVQRAIEERGIPTVGVSLQRTATEAVRPPRTVFLRYPFGHPFGRPGAVAEQRHILLDALAALVKICVPGEIVDLPYRWRRTDFAAAASPLRPPGERWWSRVA